MRRILRWVFVAILAPSAVSAQAADVIIAGEGWEAFPDVRYEGGDARHSRKLTGVLVLTDSTLGFYPCRHGQCVPDKTRPIWKEPAHFIIPLTAIETVEASSRVRAPGVGSKIVWGMFANDRAEEFVGIVHETESSAEAPVFKVRQTQSSAIDAKIRFRLKKLGRELLVP